MKGKRKWGRSQLTKKEKLELLRRSFHAGCRRCKVCGCFYSPEFHGSGESMCPDCFQKYVVRL
ncbi:MAG: hypothetical protein ACXQTW_00255 [Candidatus Methanospirareceae archaeon]